MESIVANYLRPWKDFLNFSGRAARMEYWTFSLINGLLATILATVDDLVGLTYAKSAPGVLTTVFYLFWLVPWLAVAVRRLHDKGLSGWFMVLFPLPPGAVALLILFMTDGRPGDNQYGQNPKSPLLPYEKRDYDPLA